MMEASDQGNGIGRERLFVCQLIFCQVNFFNLPLPEWPLNPMEGKIAGAHGNGEWDYMSCQTAPSGLM